ncbi:MAG: transcriptional regulator [Verrucomicrobiota bacterium]|nr:transcriptional regulator [Verrucomicrobiota bacterium]
MSDIPETKRKFITSWGEMGTCWGINRTMAQIHALMMVSNEPLSTDQIMGELQISRGNANMNLRDLISWGLIRREVKIGDRKEYFVGEKDVWKMFCTIVRERKKREIEPVIKALQDCIDDVKESETTGIDKKLLDEKLHELLDFVQTADVLMEKISRQEKNKIFPQILKLLK